MGSARPIGPGTAPNTTPTGGDASPTRSLERIGPEAPPAAGDVAGGDQRSDGGPLPWIRVWPAQGWATGKCVDVKLVGLLIEKQGENSPTKLAFSNLPAGTSRIAAVRLRMSRWPVEQGYQQLKEELGLDHFAGRSWRGFHPHATMTLLAYGFLLLERHR